MNYRTEELLLAAFEGVLTFLITGIYLGSFPSADRFGMTTIWGFAGACALFAVGIHLVFAVIEGPGRCGVGLTGGMGMEGEQR